MVEQETDSFEDLDQKSGVNIRQDGGPAALKGLSIRGSTSKEVGVFFEGIRMNSFASGELDLGLISPMGLGNNFLIKGGHHSYSSSPQGALFLELPKTEATETQLVVGDYYTFGLYQRHPGISFSLDHSHNDYAYEINGQRQRREDNAHYRVNLRLWKRWSDGQVWAQLLNNNIQLPGPVNLAFNPVNSWTLRPMTALQLRFGLWQLDTFFSYQRQTYDEDINHSISSIARLSHRRQITENLAQEISFEESLDWLNAARFESPVRSLSLLTWNLLWNPTPTWLLNPQLQADFVSDLEEAWALTGTLGIKRALNTWLTLSHHWSYTSRVPNFNEMYFEIPPSFVSNKNLKREESLQVDLGWESQNSNLTASQSVFLIRTNNTISSVSTDGIFQSQNSGAGARLGLENDIKYRWSNWGLLRLSYELLIARIQSSNESLWRLDPIKSSTKQLYQPIHKASLSQSFFLGQVIEINPNLVYRSSVRASSDNDEIPQQWNAGLVLKARQTRLIPLETKLTIENILSWNREETFGYPLGSEPRVTLSLQKIWN